MKERPILFSAPMVRAIMAGTKTQTRRVVKPGGWNPASDEYSGLMAVRAHDDPRIGLQAYFRHQASGTGHGVRCPYGQPGDRLWVREAWRAVWSSDDEPPRAFDAAYRFWYEADAPLQDGYGKLRPSIHMPRAASRITLELTAVRVERLQDISEADAIAEGGQEALAGWWSHEGLQWNDPGPNTRFGGTAIDSYRVLWEQINGPGSWDANPWVWVVEFKRGAAT